LTSQPGVRIERIGMTGFPLSQPGAEFTEAAAIWQAPFGRGTETLAGTTVRDVFGINLYRFSHNNPLGPAFRGFQWRRNNAPVRIY